MAGSSPHTRGAQRVGLRPRRGERIIPAYAGSTTYNKTGSYLEPDHPRIRGEHDIRPRNFVGLVGSSPHTRGARPRRPGRPVPGRIIPAYAGSTSRSGTSAEGTSDHPRIRGEHPGRGFDAVPYGGSSPHTRGAPRAPRHYRLGARIIPAYAGSTSVCLTNRIDSWDHPRIRGEHPWFIDSRGWLAGSSPHTRGARWRRSRGGGVRRIIPAYAGSTCADRSAPILMTDHPRIRGEHLTKAGSARVRVGSSPHTRGAPSKPRPGGSAQRIIPAYAGSTTARSATCWPWQDHPRIRGEHDNPAKDNVPFVGSSPHTRGARMASRRNVPLPWIIPAYAGSTAILWAWMTIMMDHPRIRGEHTRSHAQRGWGGGSSPHTRGARLWRPPTSPIVRIIPAYAGSTRPSSFAGTWYPDHPRIRGEHAGGALHVTGARGSSPHTRGALLASRALTRNMRIIPAYAGSTLPGDLQGDGGGDHPRIRGEHRPEFLQAQGVDGSSPHTRGAHPGGSRPCGSRTDHPRIRGEHTWKSLQYQGSPS